MAAPQRRASAGYNILIVKSCMATGVQYLTDVWLMAVCHRELGTTACLCVRGDDDDVRRLAHGILPSNMLDQWPTRRSSGTSNHPVLYACTKQNRGTCSK